MMLFRERRQPTCPAVVVCSKVSSRRPAALTSLFLVRSAATKRNGVVPSVVRLIPFNGALTGTEFVLRTVHLRSARLRE